MDNKLILSIFPGIDLLGRAFEEQGFCVVRGPDLLWGGDVRKFYPPAGVFWGVIGGPPCQDFSGKRRTAPTGYGLKMLKEFCRVVLEARPEWFLMENVARVPGVTELGHTYSAELSHLYTIQRLDINEGWYGESTRLRHIQFGSLSGRQLNIDRHLVTATEGAALANDHRSFDEVKRLQGLPPDFNLPPFKAAEKVKAIGNGVPLNMGRVLAQAVLEVYSRPVILQCDLAGRVTPTQTCACGCGRQVTGKQQYYDYSCRKRAQRKRDRVAGSQFDFSGESQL
jgi:DNA (cytosine-5)-methyltransferase 1